MKMQEIINLALRDYLEKAGERPISKDTAVL